MYWHEEQHMAKVHYGRHDTTSCCVTVLLEKLEVTLSCDIIRILVLTLKDCINLNLMYCGHKLIYMCDILKLKECFRLVYILPNISKIWHINVILLLFLTFWHSIDYCYQRICRFFLLFCAVSWTSFWCKGSCSFPGFTNTNSLCFSWFHLLLTGG